jgi:hypothetical protein
MSLFKEKGSILTISKNDMELRSDIRAEISYRVSITLDFEVRNTTE